MPDYREYWNPERETMTPAEIRDVQNEKLPHAVGNGYHNAPIIRTLWKEHGVLPEDVETIDDLTRAPVFRKRDARAYMNEHGDPYGGRRTLPLSELAAGGAVAGSSSGTTGTPTNVVLSAHDRDVIAECEARLFWEMGLRPGDNFFCWGPFHHLGSLTFQDGAERIGTVVTRTELSPNHVERAIHFLTRFEPTAMKVVSDPIIDAMDAYFEENDVDPEAVWGPVESVCFGGLMLTESRRRHLTEEWGVEVFEHGGGTEPHWHAGECREHGGWLHAHDDHYFFEVIEPETGERLGPGERGELVITALTYDAMAHVRWAHDDVVEIRRGTCDCGRTGTRIKILGRVGEVVRVGDRKLLPYDALTGIEGMAELPNNVFQFYRKADGNETELRMKVGYSPERTSDRAALATAIERRLEDDLAVPVRVVDVVPEAEIMESGASYKFGRVIED